MWIIVKITNLLNLFPSFLRKKTSLKLEVAMFLKFLFSTIIIASFVVDIPNANTVLNKIDRGENA